MIIAKIAIDSVTGRVEECTPIPKGIVGAQVALTYTDPVWDSLSKTVVFRGVETKDVVEPGDTVEIPWETVALAGKNLYMGVYGVDAAGELVVPTIWINLGPIEGAADPSGDLSTDPTLGVWAQILAKLGDLNSLDTQAKDTLVAAVNELAARPAGTGDSAAPASGVVCAPETAAPGQLLMVQSVDEDGKPLAWTAVDRTHCVEKEMIELYPERELERMEDAGDVAAFVIRDVLSLKAGIEYRVCWNGTEYLCSAQKMEEGGMTYWTLGNLGISPGGTDTGEPFMLLEYPAEYVESTGIAAAVLPLDGADQVMLSVSYEAETIRRLDNKFLDLDWLPVRREVLVAAEKTVTDDINDGFPELNASMVSAGQTLVMYCDGERSELTVVDAGDGSYMAIGVEFSLLIYGSKTLFYGDGNEHLASVYAYEYNRIPAEYLPDSWSGGAVSPTVEVSEIDGGHQVDITDTEGTESFEVLDGVSPAVNITKSGKVTTITITDATGVHTATIFDGVDGVDGSGSGGESGIANEYTLLGQTPQKLSGSGTVKLSCEEACTYTVKSDTVADFNIAGGTPLKATLSEVNGHYQLSASSDAANWYETYVDLSVGGLTVNESYNLLFDAVGMEWDSDNYITQGHFILYDADGNTLATRNAADGSILHVHAFTATTENVRIRWYPAAANTFASGESVANVNAIYINRAGTTTHTDIMNLSGTFTGTTLLGSLSKGVTISAAPACYVYRQSAASSAAAAGRHAGKVCVCFGDSVTGNMTAPYDYPSVLAEETGMDVVNGGFGGCRMSDTHPTAAYAAFSMVKLAEAAASGDWSLQESYVEELSQSTNGTAHLAALKAVDWSSVDFVTIAYGTNDINGSVAIDDEGNSLDTSTYLGALRYSLVKLLTAYPHLKVLLLTPIYRFWNDEGLDSDEKQFGGHAFTDWGDGLLEVAKEYKIPAVDMYRTLGFNAITRGCYFSSSDGTHPNALGLKVIGGKIAAKLLAEY